MTQSRLVVMQALVSFAMFTLAILPTAVEDPTHDRQNAQNQRA